MHNILKLAYENDIQAIIEYAKNKIAQAELSKKPAKLSTYKVMQAIMQKENKTHHRENLKKTWIDNGKQYYCNGHMAIKLNNPIKQLDTSEEHGLPNINNLFTGFDLYPSNATKVDILTAYKINKATKGDGIYPVGDSFYSLNYLKYAIDLISTGLIFKQMETNNNAGLRHLILYNDDIEMLILPICHPKKEAE